MPIINILSSVMMVSLLKFFIQKEYLYGGQISKILLLALQAKSFPGSLLNKALAVVDALEGKVHFFLFRYTLFSFLESITYKQMFGSI